jgi:hypothetical protein
MRTSPYVVPRRTGCTLSVHCFLCTWHEAGDNSTPPPRADAPAFFGVLTTVAASPQGRDPGGSMLFTVGLLANRGLRGETSVDS